jgi:endo-1,4-beta-mannosidase
MSPPGFGRFRLGVNYWSRRGGPRMWEGDHFDEAFLRAELAALKAIGVDLLRPFAFIPTFMPAPPAVDRAALDRFGAFVRIAEAEGLSLLPTAIVGHMSGENYDFPGRAGRSLYLDPELVGWQTALAAALVDAARASHAVVGWVLSNEMPLYGGPASPDEANAWAGALKRAIRARDHRPIGAGDGLMAGFPSLAEEVDWVAPHVYYADLDPLRQAYHLDLRLRRAQSHGLPVLLEEFGCSSSQAGATEQAAYWREAMCVALGIGAVGALGWCASDFALHDAAPYRHHPFELGFGALDRDGREKPVCEELRALRRLIDSVDLRATRPPSRAAIVVPRVLDEEIPFSWDDRSALAATLLQAYVLACQAGLDPDVVPESAPLDRYALLLCPSTQKLGQPTWDQLAACARGGATVYWSYFSGEQLFHQGAWCGNFAELTGLSHRLRYGCFDLPGDALELKGELTLTIPIRSVDAVQSLARLPVEVQSGAPVRVRLTDGRGAPALVEHALGAGRVLFCPYPIERYLRNLPDGSSYDAHRLYRLIAAAADLDCRYPTHHPDVQSRVIEAGGDDLVLVQHRGFTQEVDDATLWKQAELIYDRPGERGRRADPSTLGPKGARLYRVRGARPAPPRAPSP